MQNLEEEDDDDDDADDGAGGGGGDGDGDGDGDDENTSELEEGAGWVSAGGGAVVEDELLDAEYEKEAAAAAMSGKLFWRDSGDVVVVDLAGEAGAGGRGAESAADD